jgi:hypothetical protein
MDDLIRRSDLKRHINSLSSHYLCEWDTLGVLAAIDSIPAVDAVERGVFEQVAWERDIAIKQLADIGKSLGEKMDDVAKVVRCRECKYYDMIDRDDVVKACLYWKSFMSKDGYCSIGERREDGDGDA